MNIEEAEVPISWNKAYLYIYHIMRVLQIKSKGEFVKHSFTVCYNIIRFILVRKRYRNA